MTENALLKRLLPLFLALFVTNSFAEWQKYDQDRESSYSIDLANVETRGPEIVVRQLIEKNNVHSWTKSRSLIATWQFDCIARTGKIVGMQGFEALGGNGAVVFEVPPRPGGMEPIKQGSMPERLFEQYCSAK